MLFGVRQVLHYFETEAGVEFTGAVSVDEVFFQGSVVTRIARISRIKKVIRPNLWFLFIAMDQK